MLKRILMLSVAFALVAAFAAPRRSAAQPTVTIQYWNINTATFGGPQVDALIASFEAANPTIKVESVPKQSYPALIEDAQLAISAGNPPDIVQMGWPFLKSTAINLPYVSPAMLVEKFGGQETLDALAPNVRDLTLVDGNSIGLSYSLSNAVAYYNADLFEQAGLDPENPPQTIAEWTEAGRIFKEKLNLPINSIDYGGDNWAVENLIASNGGSLLVCTDGKYASGLDSAEAAEALQTWADWVANGYAVNALDKARQAFWEGSAGSLLWSIAGRATIQANATFDLRATSYPSFGEKPVRLPTGGNFLVFLSTDEAKQEAAWKFAQHLLSKEGVTEWTKGTGYVPPIPGLAEDPAFLADFIQEQPIQQVAFGQLDKMFTWTSFPGPDGQAASRALFEAVQAALGGQATAKDALLKAHEEINRLVGNEACAN
jgi:multiple sugar transport system substrate-binding protein